MTATLNDFRQVSASSFSYFCGTAVAPDTCEWEFSVSIVPLYKRSYKMFNISASGGYRLGESGLIPSNIALIETFGGRFHYGFLTDLAVLSSIFGPAINPAAYAANAIQIAYPPNTQQTVTSLANLVALDSKIISNDLQKNTVQVVLGAQGVSANTQQSLFDSLNNLRNLFALPFGYFGAQISAISTQSDPVYFPQNFIIQPGFDFLVLFPFAGITPYGFAGGGGPGFGHYFGTHGFNLSSSLNFNMLPLSSEDFERIIPV